MDDGLKSVGSPEKAIDLIARTQDACSLGGLKLHKFNSSSLKVLESHNENTYQKPHCLDPDALEKVLGVYSMPSTDTFTFHSQPKD